MSFFSLGLIAGQHTTTFQSTTVVVQAYLKEWCHQTFDLELYYKDLYKAPMFKKTQKPCIIVVYDEVQE